MQNVLRTRLHDDDLPTRNLPDDGTAVPLAFHDYEDRGLSDHLWVSSGRQGTCRNNFRPKLLAVDARCARLIYVRRSLHRLRAFLILRLQQRWLRRMREVLRGFVGVSRRRNVSSGRTIHELCRYEMRSHRRLEID